MLEYIFERRCFIIAKKGQKFIRFSDEGRTEIVNKYLSGKYGYHTLANEYGFSGKTVESMVRKYRKTGTTIAQQKGRLKEEVRHTYYITYNYPYID